MARLPGACAVLLVALSPAVASAGDWSWLQPYRVWEANRQVFLYPENWLQPDPEGCGTAACRLDLSVAGELQGIPADSALATEFHDGQRFTAEGRLNVDGTFELTNLTIGGDPDGGGRPRKFEGPELSAAASDVVIEELSLDGEGLEPEGAGSGSGGVGPSAEPAACLDRRCLAVVVHPTVLLSPGAADAARLSPSIRLVFADDAGTLSVSNLHERISQLLSVQVRSISVSAAGRSEAWRATVSAVRLVAAPRFGRELLRSDFDLDVVEAAPSPSPAGPPAGDAITLQNGSGASSILVQGPSASFPGNSVRLVKAAGEGNSPVLEGHPDPAFGPYAAGRYQVSWRSSSEALQHYGFAAIVAPGNYPAFTLNYSMTGALVLQDGNGVVDTGVAYAPGVAQRFEALIDLDARSFDLWVDGVRVAEARPFQHQGFTALDRFVWEIGGVDAEAYAITDLRVACFAFSDVRPPVTTLSASTAPNALGWSREPVSVAVSASDGCAGSGVQELHLVAGGAETVLRGEAASVEVADGETVISAYAVDRAGNRDAAQGATATIRVDRNAPAIRFDGSCPGTVTLGSASTLSVAVSDDRSGIAAQSVASGPQPLATATVGTRVFTVTASDRAGNASANACTYRVIYDFVGAGGFAAPVKAPPAVNTVKAGSAVPLRWRLPDGSGGYVAEVGVVTSIRFQEAACQGFGTLQDAVPVDAVGSGASGLRYDPDANQFVFSWKTSTAMAGRCYVVTLALDDGSEHRVNLSVR